MPPNNSPIPTAYNKDKADEIWAMVCNAVPTIATIHPRKDIHDALAGNSPFLANIMESLPETASQYLEGNPDEVFENIITTLKKSRPLGETTDDLMLSLRQYKAQISLLVALADISGDWPLPQITVALSRFADVALELCLAHLLHRHMKNGELAWPAGKEEPVSASLCQNAGYFILGMGKLGAFELNYSSDIDLIVLYDPDSILYTGRKTLAQCYIKITQDLVRMMDQRTMHGYVFRTDLRLRPDPGATPVAINVNAALSYYHSIAVNWERSAMIKARVVAGDKQAGTAFLKEMNSWIWRRSMDFAALKDIANIKNQINHHYGQKDEIGPGYNVKLGYGGIREIEFFTQINQLLHAGRHPELRVRGTVQALEILFSLDLLKKTILQDLSQAYIFLRTLEHRIQMIHDAQTHELPESAEDMERLACFMGFSSAGNLIACLREHTEKVSVIYDSLMPDFTPTDELILTKNLLLSTLNKYAFTDPTASANLIDQWRLGRYRALRTDRAKNLLEQCLPTLLLAFSKTHDPSAALIRFDSFISKLPAGVQLFSLLHANPSLFKLLARIMGLAPALADILAKKPNLWDMVLEPHFFDPVEDKNDLIEELDIRLHSANDYQDILDLVRRFVAEQKFRTGIHLMEGLADVEETGGALTLIADIALTALITHVTEDFSKKHGEFLGGGIAVLAMGKYGGGELTHTSDLDIVFLYHCEDMKSVSNGEKPLSPSQYFSRLGQHIITAITALTPEGRLFEVDTRLRPSGSQGPLVVTLKTFEDYYTNSAWTWEHMALTRARIIIAPKKMRAKLSRTVRGVLTSNRDKHALLLAVSDMREKLFKQFGTKNKWAIKHCRGGLIDMEFICQYLMLREGHQHQAMFEPNLPRSIFKLSENRFLTPQEKKLMLDSHALMQRIQSLLRLCVGHAPVSSKSIPEGLQKILINATGQATFLALERALQIQQDLIYKLYIKLIEEPAK